MRRASRLTFTFAGMVACSAVAQSFEWYDFEGGSIAAAGFNETRVAGTTNQVSSAAAHGGTFGYRFVDGETNPTIGGRSFIWRTVPLSASLYLRSWVRATGLSDAGDMRFLDVAFYDQPFGGAVNSYVVSEATDWVLIQYLHLDGGSGTTAVPGPAALADGGWHLFEAATLGLGTDSATVIFAIDGLERHRLVDVGLATRETSGGLELGGIYANGPFTGTIDLDEVALSNVPPPTRLRIVAPTTVALGDCVVVEASLASSLPWPDGGNGDVEAFAPMTLEVLGGGGPFLDANCQQPGAPALAPGQQTSSFSVRVTSGTLTVRHRAPNPDVFDGVVVWSLDAGGDGGASDGGATDGGASDGGASDGGASDGGASDGGASDGGASDGGATDGGATDGGATDGGATDGGATDGGDRLRPAYQVACGCGATGAPLMTFGVLFIGCGGLSSSRNRSRRRAQAVPNG